VEQVQPPAGASPTSARDLIDRAVKAKGGLEKLRSIRTVKATATTTLFGESAAADVETTSYIRYPNAFRIDAKMPAGPVIQVFNGGDYWIQSARGVATPDEAVAEQIRGTVQRDVIGVLLAITDGRARAERTADIVDNGRGLPAIRVSGPGITPFSILLDPETSLILAERYQIPAGRGAWMTVEEAFSDYQSVDGLQVAFNAVVRRDGRPMLTRRLRAFEYNVPLDPALFTKPS
jgi:hypothetical protein